MVLIWTTRILVVGTWTAIALMNVPWAFYRIAIYCTAEFDRSSRLFCYKQWSLSDGILLIR